MKRYYIAYGSNLNVQQMRWRCPGARIIGTAELQDYRLLFKGSKTGSYLTVEPEKGCTVPVAVWEVTEQDELALDRYEGYPSFYYKTEMTLDVKGIRTGKLRRRRAFVYIMQEERPYGIPTSIAGQGHVCGSSGFDRGGQYPTLQLDRVQNALMDMSLAIERAVNSRFDKLHEVFMPVSMALLTNFDDTFLGIGPAKRED